MGCGIGPARRRCHCLRKIPDDPDLFYWPSFEIAKWASAHCNVTPYGGFDGRHVDALLVDAIIQKFLTLFFDHAPKAPAS
jgi:hypothetical protein